MKRATCVGAALLLCTPILGNAAEEQRVDFARPARLSDSTYAGVSFQLREYLGDHAYRVIANTEGDVQVDYRATAVLEFAAPIGEGAGPSERWTRINRLLPLVREVSERRLVLNALTIVHPDTLLAAMKPFNQAVTAVRSELEELPGMSKADFESILKGTFDGSQPAPRRAFANIIRWLVREIAQGQAELDALAAAPTMTVTVDATVQPTEGTRRGVAIEDWNEIGNGDLERKEPETSPSIAAKGPVIDAATSAAEELEEIAGHASKPTAKMENTAEGKAVADVESALKALPKSIAIPRTARPLGRLVPARVDLRAAGARPGDLVRFKLRFWDTKSREFARFQKDFGLRVRELGFYARTAGVVIIERRSAGAEEDQAWKTNVAAVATGFYRIRSAHDGLPRVWNWLGLGLGVHLASVDHTDQAVEFGLGLSASIWDGLLYGGSGFNLMLPENDPADHGYHFVGTNLFEVLQRAQKVLKDHNEE